MNEDHVPRELIYGPVDSRRFGRSLGVSCSAPGRTVCRWRCPYCQLGDWPWDATAPWPASAAILAALRARVAEAGPIDAITVAGGGEPTDHPDFAALSAAMRSIADTAAARLLLLSNGDGLENPAKRQALVHYHQVQIKWDPGTVNGMWRPGGPDRAARIEALRMIRPLHLQSMLFHGPGGGNCRPQHITDFIGALQLLEPTLIHLGSIDRDPHNPRLTALDSTTLHAQAAFLRSQGLPVRVVGANT